jgi:hypothetical protein
MTKETKKEKRERITERMEEIRNGMREKEKNEK